MIARVGYKLELNFSAQKCVACKGHLIKGITGVAPCHVSLMAVSARKAGATVDNLRAIYLSVSGINHLFWNRVKTAPKAF